MSQAPDADSMQSIQQQLAERRRRLEEEAARHRENAEPMDLDTPFAENRHEIERELVSLSSREHELQSELESAQHQLAARRARLGVLRRAESGSSTEQKSQPSPAETQAPAEPELTQEEKDHEIAVLLQRQFEREDAEREREREREQTQASEQRPQSRSFSFQMGRSGGGPMFSYSSSGGDPEHARDMMSMLNRFGLGGMDFDDRGGMDPFVRRQQLSSSERMAADPLLFPFMGPMGPMGASRFQRVGISPHLFGPVGPFGMMGGGMDIDLDNMDHDQILRLQEMIGHVPRGASVREISELPTSRFHATEETGREDEEKPKCSICLEEFEDGEEIRRLPCFHIFHTDEIDKWLTQNSECPICRVPIQSRDDADGASS